MNLSLLVASKSVPVLSCLSLYARYDRTEECLVYDALGPIEPCLACIRWIRLTLLVC